MTVTKSGPANKNSIRKVQLIPRSSHSEQVRLVNTSLPGIKVISRKDLWNDFRNRLKINNYEIGLLANDLNKLAQRIQPVIINIIDTVEGIIISFRKALHMDSK